jgi:hypothetical protein
MSASFGAPPPLPPTSPGIPWEDRDRLGFGTALFETTKQALLTPVDFFKAMPVSGGLGGPLVYGLILSYAGVIVEAVWRILFNAIFGAAWLATIGQMLPANDFARISPFLHGGGVLVGLMVTMILAVPLLLIAFFISAGITHLFLMLLGGAKRGFEATFRVVCYCQAAAVFSAVPLCGGLIRLVYQIVLAVIGLAEAHGISRGVAAAAVLLPLLLVCCCCAGSAFLLAGSVAHLFNRGRF